jgi:hypothetical protein
VLNQQLRGDFERCLPTSALGLNRAAPEHLSGVGYFFRFDNAI